MTVDVLWKGVKRTHSCNTPKPASKTQKVQWVDDNICGYCGKEYVEDEEWIDYDVCHRWYHRLCVNVSDEFWNMVTEDASNFEFTHPICK